MKHATQRFSTYVADRLRRAEGYDGRRVAAEIDGWQDSLSPDGLLVHSAARRVFEEFGGLMIGLEYADAEAKGKECVRGEVCVDPRRCLGQGDLLRSFSRFASGTLSPLGDAFAHRVTIAIDESGAISRVTPYRLSRGGDSFEKALDRLRHGRLPNEVATIRWPAGPAGRNSN